MLKKLLFGVACIAALVAGFALAQAGLLDTKGALLLVLGGMVGIMLVYRPFFKGDK